MLAEEDNFIFSNSSNIITKVSKILYYSYCIIFFQLQGQTSSDAIRLFEKEKGFGTYALGLGGAYSALSNDYSGIYWNPAGLSSIKKSTLNIEFNNNYVTNNINFLNNSFFTHSLTDH